MYGVAFALDAVGDVYLVGRLPLDAVTADELDRLLGCVLEYADGTFDTLLELGFADVDPAGVAPGGSAAASRWPTCARSPTSPTTDRDRLTRPAADQRSEPDAMRLAA